MPDRHTRPDPPPAGEAIDTATSDAEVKARFAEIGAEATPAEPDRLGERLVRERALVRQLVRDTGISLG